MDAPKDDGLVRVLRERNGRCNAREDNIAICAHKSPPASILERRKWPHTVSSDGQRLAIASGPRCSRLPEMGACAAVSSRTPMPACTLCVTHF